MPKQVDHVERRRAIAEAVFEVIGSRGLDAVSLRDVAAQAGTSMGAVQHYFTSKEEMLLFALDHLRDRVMRRLEGELGQLVEPTRRQTARAAMAAMLPLDEPSRQEACVNVAFFSVATVAPTYASLLRDGFARLLEVTRSQLEAAADAGEVVAGIDVADEATALFVTAHGLVGPVLIGLFTPAEAMALIDRRLDRIFRPSDQKKATADRG